MVSNFLEKYAQDGPGAVAELINFVLKSAGCDLQVSEDDVNDSDNVNGKIADLQEEHQTVCLGTILAVNHTNFSCSKTYPTTH